jgi:hypothetical protein
MFTRKCFSHKPQRTRLWPLCKVPTPCGPCKQGIQVSLHPSSRN